MKTFWIAFCLLLTAMPAVSGNNVASPANGTPQPFDVEAVTSRVEAMTNEAVTPRYNSVVQGYIKTYVLKARRQAEEILGLSILYFPLFEKYLAERNFPLDLRYLPVVESALNPQAVSRAGAVGLWQFMPETAREVGLHIDDLVDERRDPHKSTEAAMRYLQRLYDRYGQWELALAAYNSGPGRVNRAIKRGRSRDFWRIRRYLPRETRNYVPAFIAAAYLMQHYEAHDLQPAFPLLDQQLTETVKIYDSFSFYELAQVTGLPLNLIESLNPAYGEPYIPVNPRGHFLTLPSRVMPAFLEYAELRRHHPHLRQVREDVRVLAYDPAHQRDETHYRTSYYEVVAGDTLPALAAQLQYTVHQLRAWNRLKTDQLLPGQRLLLYTPRNIRRFKRQDALGEMLRLDVAPLPANLSSTRAYGSSDPLHGQKKIFYFVKKRERMSEIVDRLPGTTLSDLILLNDRRSNGGKLQRGARICIREL